jgi:hypothetical protein
VKTSAKMFWALTAFYLGSSALYAVWSLLDRFHGQIEWVGTLALGLCGVLFGFIAFYLGRTHRAQGGEIPSDIATADIDDGDPEMGFFSPWSWWPLVLAAGAALVFLGLAVGPWVSLIGIPLAFIALFGWIYEYYRGAFAR